MQCFKAQMVKSSAVRPIMLVIIVMDAATLDVLVASTLSSWGHGCCDSGCAGSTDVIIVARTLSSWGHGCCDIGCAGSTDVIILGPWMLRQWMCW